ncbi:hypothetical protein O9929_08060 [Vibrio lentus]|nr:hypothetical protein [Vibrio lentus]
MMLNHDEFDTVYTRTGGDDRIGLISITPVDCIVVVLKTSLMIQRYKTDQYAGVEIEYKKFPDAGPPVVMT